MPAPGAQGLDRTICGHVYAHQGKLEYFKEKKKKKKGKGQSGVRKVRRGSLATLVSKAAAQLN